jgi:hypothetical protein
VGGYGFFLKKYSDSQCRWKKYSDFGGGKKKYWIPKLHRNPYRERYITSHKLIQGISTRNGFVKCRKFTCLHR